MFRVNQIVVLIFYTLSIYSCKGQTREGDCIRKFNKARELAYAYPIRQSALDSALYLVNESINCDDIRKAAVDLKITLLVSMKKYSDGINFIRSLKEGDFTFRYKKQFMTNALSALEYNSKKDTIKRDLVYKAMANNIEHYITNENIDDKEFVEIYTDLFSIKEKYLDANQINMEVEALKNKYPNKQSFFDLFKK
jgi:hypothetical protein